MNWKIARPAILTISRLSAGSSAGQVRHPQRGEAEALDDAGAVLVDEGEVAQDLAGGLELAEPDEENGHVVVGHGLQPRVVGEAEEARVLEVGEGLLVVAQLELAHALERPRRRGLGLLGDHLAELHARFRVAVEVVEDRPRREAALGDQRGRMRSAFWYSSSASSSRCSLWAACARFTSASNSAAARAGFAGAGAASDAAGGLAPGAGVAVFGAHLRRGPGSPRHGDGGEERREPAAHGVVPPGAAPGASAPISSFLRSALSCSTIARSLSPSSLRPSR